MCLIIRKDSLFLVTGSCCGRLFTSCFNVDTATTKQIKLSEYKITSLVEFREYVCASDQSGRIYVIDCVELVVVAELWTTVIFSDTMKRKLFIDDKCLLLA